MRHRYNIYWVSVSWSVGYKHICSVCLSRTEEVCIEKKDRCKFNISFGGDVGEGGGRGTHRTKYVDLCNDYCWGGQPAD